MYRSPAHPPACSRSLLTLCAFLGVAASSVWAQQPVAPVPSNNPTVEPVPSNSPAETPVPSNAPTGAPESDAPGVTITPPIAGAPTPDLAEANSVTSEIIPPADRVTFEPIPYDGPDVPSSEAVRANLADARLRAGEAAPLLPLTEVITDVLQNNPQRAATREALEAALARIGNAKSGGRLQVDLSANASRNRPFGAPSISAPAGTGGDPTGGMGGNNSSSLAGFGLVNEQQSIGIDASYSLYSGGRVSATVNQARSNARAQAALTLQTEQNLVTNSATSYLEVLRRAQLLEVADNNLAVSRERRRVAIRRFEGGAAPRVDVLNADANLADAQQRRIQAVSDVAQAKASLNILRGVNPETPFRTIAAQDFAVDETLNTPIVGAPVAPAPETAVFGQTTPIGKPLPTTTTPGIAPDGTTVVGATGANAASTTPIPIAEDTGQTLRNLAEAARPSLEQNRAQIEAADQQINIAKAQKKPSIGLNLGGLLRNPVTFAGRFALTLAGSLAQNLFDGGRAKAQITEARSLAAQSRDNLQDQRLQVADQIERALLAFDAAQNRLDTTGAAVVAAQGALRATQTGYAAGTKTQVDISDAQSVLLQAQTDAVNARFSVATARVNISAATGVLLPEAQTAYDEVIAAELAAKQKGNFL